MAYKRVPSINHQIKERFDSMMKIGESKKAAKIENKMQEGIFSYGTRHSYDRAMQNFAKYCKASHGVKIVDDMKPFVNEYIQDLRSRGISAWTQKRDLAAIGKYYQESFFDRVETDVRSRSNVIRSRETVGSDAHFSTVRNDDLINFCKHTGLRRRELENIKGDCLSYKDGQAYIHVQNGKGGRERYVPILNNNQRVIDQIEATRAEERVWGRVHAHADIHGYRAEYANAMYEQLARDVRELPFDEVYHCKADKAGVWYDKQAMQEVSEALGHSRIDVIAQSYLR